MAKQLVTNLANFSGIVNPKVCMPWLVVTSEHDGIVVSITHSILIDTKKITLQLITAGSRTSTFSIVNRHPYRSVEAILRKCIDQ
jgi:hypothetical protein